MGSRDPSLTALPAILSSSLSSVPSPNLQSRLRLTPAGPPEPTNAPQDLSYSEKTDDELKAWRERLVAEINVVDAEIRLRDRLEGRLAADTNYRDAQTQTVGTARGWKTEMSIGRFRIGWLKKKEKGTKAVKGQKPTKPGKNVDEKTRKDAKQPQDGNAVGEPWPDDIRRAYGDVLDEPWDDDHRRNLSPLQNHVGTSVNGESSTHTSLRFAPGLVAPPASASMSVDSGVDCS